MRPELAAAMRWRSDFAGQPLFASVSDVARRLAVRDAWPSLEELNRLARFAGIVNARGLPLRFVSQTSPCSQRDYEARILASGEVPTRADNWHDLFNALVWLTFPRTKAALNAVQCRCLQVSGRGGNRPPLSDAATLFDESGLILVTQDDALVELLRAHRWQEVFLSRRAAWRDVRVYLFGHALLEKSLAPFPAMTAKCLCLQLDPLPPADSAPPPEVDATVAAMWLEGTVTRPADLFPVPVLGIPGLWPENRIPGFYDDNRVFRARPSQIGKPKSDPP